MDALGGFLKVSLSPSHVNIPASCDQMSTLVKLLDQDVCSLGRIGLYEEDLQLFNGLFVGNS